MAPMNGAMMQVSGRLNAFVFMVLGTALGSIIVGWSAFSWNFVRHPLG